MKEIDKKNMTDNDNGLKEYQKNCRAGKKINKNKKIL